jgi:hypothetical protein
MEKEWFLASVLSVATWSRPMPLAVPEPDGIGDEDCLPDA